jgi:hypothetical protein
MIRFFWPLVHPGRCKTPSKVPYKSHQAENGTIGQAAFNDDGILALVLGPVKLILL